MGSASLSESMQELSITSVSASGYELLQEQSEDEAIEEDLFFCDDECMDGDEDINFVDDGSSLDDETNRFDKTVGALEDVLMDPEFEDARETFCRNNCQHFEDSDENKLIYTEIFDKYTKLVEAGIESRLKDRIQGFNMHHFMVTLSQREQELMSDVFDLLLSLGDFETFKEVMLSYKRELSDGDNAFAIHCMPMQIHTEEQEDGEERPDLDFGLTISPVGAHK